MRAKEIVIVDSGGSRVILQRLARGATTFLRATGGRWEEVDGAGEIPPRQTACIQTLMSRGNLLALRVFLGATCGPV